MAENISLPQKSRADQTTSESTRGGMYFTPRVDIYENDKELTLYADVPGVRPEDVAMRYERGQLFLHARVLARPQQPNYLVAEYDEGDFYRVFDIHESIDAGKIEAECKNGVLTVHLPKVEGARPRQITVRSK
jgi:HSP20 family protein